VVIIGVAPSEKWFSKKKFLGGVLQKFWFDKFPPIVIL